MEKILTALLLKNEQRHRWHQTSIGVLLMVCVPIMILLGILGVSLGVLAKAFVVIVIIALILGSVCYSNEKNHRPANTYQRFVYAVWDMAMAMKEDPVGVIKGVWNNYRITKDDTKEAALRKLVICIGIVVYTVVGGALTFGCIIIAAAVIGGVGPDYRVCPLCGAYVYEDTDVCPECGASLV